MFEDNVCVDLSGILDGKHNYAKLPFSKLFVGPCVDRLEVMVEGLDHVTALLSEFYASASCPLCWCPLELQWSRYRVERR